MKSEGVRGQVEGTGRGGGVKGRKRGEGGGEKKKASKILQEIRDPKEGAFR